VKKSLTQANAGSVAAALMQSVSSIPSETPSGRMNTPTRGGPSANSPGPDGQGNGTVGAVNAPRTASKAETAAVVVEPGGVRSASRVMPTAVTDTKAGSAARVFRKVDNFALPA
jgi:hypothetical protein